MTYVYFVTSNPGKLSSLKNITKDLKLPFKLKMLKAHYPEDKSEESTQAVVLAGAKYCANNFKKAVLVTDTGIFIEALNGFPGINTKFFYQKIGNQGIIKLMKGVRNRKVDWVLSLGFCQPNNTSKVFTAKLDGFIPEDLRGKKGFGFDPIFVPTGYKQTLAENPNLRDQLTPLRKTIQEFISWLDL